MANTFQNITYAVTASLADVYTCPSATVAIVIGCQAANVDGSNIVTLDLVVDKSGTDTYLLKGVEIPTKAALGCIDGKLVLEAGEKLQAKAGATSDVELVVSLLEIS